MQQLQAYRKTFSVSLFWNKRDMELKTGISGVYLTVNLPKQQFRIFLKLKCTKPEYDMVLSSSRKISDELKELRRLLNDYVSQAETILGKMNPPNKETFKKVFMSESDLFLSNKTDVFFFYQMKADEAKNEGRIGSYKNYIGCMAALKDYTSKVYFEDIDETFLKGFRSHLKSKGNSDATVGIRLRCLRGIFNVARKGKFIPKDLYPFASFPISAAGKSKSVLYPEQVKALFDYEPVGIVETRAKDYFFFCYLANGMNFKDMAMLQWKDIKNDSFTFIREKTKNTIQSGSEEIRVYLHDELKRIIKVHGNKSHKPDDYVFPILRPKTDVLRQHEDRKRKRKYINKKLTLIGKKLGFEVHLCLNLARHSFATILMLNGTPVSYISEAMGHKNTKTTEHYLKSIPLNNLKDMSSQLLSFK